MAGKGLSEHGSDQSRDLAVAAGLAVAGVALKASSQADVRYGRCSRERSSCCRCASSRASTTDRRFPNVPGLQRDLRDLVVPEQGEATYYIRIQPIRARPSASARSTRNDEFIDRLNRLSLLT